jgi:hypothetical protein
MDISAYTLTTLKDAARIPYLAEAAALALEIRNINNVQVEHFRHTAHSLGPKIMVELIVT